jgi:hypothetical protein
MVALLPLHALQATPGTPGCAPLHAPATSVGAHVDGRVAFVTVGIAVAATLAVEFEDGETPTDSEGDGEALAVGEGDAEAMALITSGARISAWTSEALRARA